MMKKLMTVLLILALGIAAFFVFQNFSRVPQILQTVFEWVGRRGVTAPVYFVVVFTAATFLFCPIILLSLAGGFLFGIVPGAFIVTVAEVCSSATAYLLSRYFLRGWVCRQIGKRVSLRVIDEVVKNAGWKMVVLTRLTPIFPFVPLNSAYGVSQIRYWPFVIASAVGFLPGAFLNAYLGSMAGSLIGIQTRVPVPGEAYFLAFSVVIAILSTIYMMNLTGKVLASHTTFDAGVCKTVPDNPEGTVKKR